MKGRLETFRSDRSPRQGSVLLMVLVTVVLLSLACYSFSDMMLTERRAVVLSGRQIQARALADSGVEAARLFLARDLYDREDAGGLYDNPAYFRGLLITEDFDGGDRGRATVIAANLDDTGSADGIRFGLENESTRLNLNALLLAEAQREGAGRSLLLALPGMTLEIADAILDWIDPDDEPREFGAEIDYYASLDPPYQPRNGPLETIEELLLIRGVTPELLFGRDANRNGLIDADEQLQEALETDELTLDRGWLPYITLYGMEQNRTHDGRPRIVINSDDLEQLYIALLEVFPDEWASFIVAYRQNGPYRQGRGGGSRGSGSGSGDSEPLIERAGERPIDLTRPGRHRFTQVLDLIGRRTSVQFEEDEEPTILESPFPDDPLAMMFYLPQLIDEVTVNPAAVIPGRININQAPRVVLSGIPGMSEEIVDEIINSRQFEPQGDHLGRRHETWLLTEGIVTLGEMRRLMPFVTAGGDVYRAQVVGYYEEHAAASRVEVVFDAGRPLPRILFWRDLSHLGRGYPLELLGSELFQLEW